MPKGFTLLELLMAVVIMAIAGTIAAGAFATVMRDIPAEKAAIDEHVTLGAMVRRMRKDVAASTDAAALTDPPGIVLTTGGAKVRYVGRTGQVERTEEVAGKSDGPKPMIWLIPHGQVQWSVRKLEDGHTVVEVRTEVTPASPARGAQTLTNAHLLVLGGSGRTGGGR